MLSIDDLKITFITWNCHFKLVVHNIHNSLLKFHHFRLKRNYPTINIFVKPIIQPEHFIIKKQEVINQKLALNYFFIGKISYLHYRIYVPLIFRSITAKDTQSGNFYEIRIQNSLIKVVLGTWLDRIVTCQYLQLHACIWNLKGICPVQK